MALRWEPLTKIISDIDRSQSLLITARPYAPKLTFGREQGLLSVAGGLQEHKTSHRGNTRGQILAELQSSFWLNLTQLDFFHSWPRSLGMSGPLWQAQIQSRIRSYLRDLLNPSPRPCSSFSLPRWPQPGPGTHFQPYDLQLNSFCPSTGLSSLPHPSSSLLFKPKFFSSFSYPFPKPPRMSGLEGTLPISVHTPSDVGVLTTI